MTMHKMRNRLRKQITGDKFLSGKTMQLSIISHVFAQNKMKICRGGRLLLKLFGAWHE